MNNNNIYNEIDKLSIDIFNGATSAFSQLEVLKVIVLNLKISVAKLPQSADTRALSEIGDIMTRAINEIELMTKGGRDVSKEIGKLVKLLKDGE